MLVHEFIGNQETDRRVHVRAQAVFLRGLGLSAGGVARLLGVHEVTVKRWLARYRREGREGLEDRPRRGRPPKLNGELREQLYQIVMLDPRLCGFNQERWTLRALRLYLKRRHGVEISEMHLSRVLRGSGIFVKSEKRPRVERGDGGG